ncbi:hypothetical protein Y032_0089g2244 [Ancylostoma ceylanicum]|uniref:Uncharacterized protein n=1 Tax=Ancylostoma ceylanicum TaxID=53326 RepID=A0A016TNB4_9BILA|nr:hypothetical protein Y032_0089g2244 [Ancylostoma ceylanicum]
MTVRALCNDRPSALQLPPQRLVVQSLKSARTVTAECSQGSGGALAWFATFLELPFWTGYIQMGTTCGLRNRANHESALRPHSTV